MIKVTKTRIISSILVGIFFKLLLLRKILEPTPYSAPIILLCGLICKLLNNKIKKYIDGGCKKYISNLYYTSIKSIAAKDLYSHIINLETIAQIFFINIPNILTYMTFYYMIPKNNCLNLAQLVFTLGYFPFELLMNYFKSKYDQIFKKSKKNLKEVIGESVSCGDYMYCNKNINYRTQELDTAYKMFTMTKYDDIYSKLGYLFIGGMYCYTSITFGTKYAILGVIYGVIVRKLASYISFLSTNCGQLIVKSPYTRVNRIVDDNRIELSDVNFSYKESRNDFSLNNFNMIIDIGKINILLGENGCGKTTIIKLILGLIHPVKGVVYSNDNISYVHNIPIIFNGTIMDNILCGESEDKVTFWCEFLGLTNWYKENKLNKTGYKGQLISKGDRKKTQLLGCLCKNTDTIIFDEPSIELDSNAIKWLSNIITRLNIMGKTIIIATHDKRITTSLPDSNRNIILLK